MRPTGCRGATPVRNTPPSTDLAVRMTIPNEPDKWRQPAPSGARNQDAADRVPRSYSSPQHPPVHRSSGPDDHSERTRQGRQWVRWLRRPLATCSRRSCLGRGCGGARVEGRPGRGSAGERPLAGRQWVRWLRRPLATCSRRSCLGRGCGGARVEGRAAGATGAEEHARRRRRLRRPRTNPPLRTSAAGPAGPAITSGERPGRRSHRSRRTCPASPPAPPAPHESAAAD